MNILIVCRELPYPPDAGYKIRTFNLIKGISKRNSISLVCYEGSETQEGYVREMKEYCEFVKLVKREDKSKIKQLPGLAKDLISGLPWYVKYSKSREMQHAIFEIAESRDFHIVHIDDPYMAANLDQVLKAGVRKSVTFHNIESISYKRISKIEKNLYHKIRDFLNWLPMQRWETRIAERFDLSIVMSSVDLQILKSKNEKLRIAVIPNGVDTHSLRPLAFSDQKYNISFVGAMDYPPNRDAVLYFYRQVLPLIRERLPKTKFFIVGRRPATETLKLGIDRSVVLTGYVEDVIPYYQKSSVMVVPLRAGGGTRLKILEAMALGRPVVSTTIGCEGLNVIDGEHLLIADDPDQFADKTIRLLLDQELYQRITINGRKLVEDQYDWDKVAGKLMQVYTEMVEPQDFQSMRANGKHPVLQG